VRWCPDDDFCRLFCVLHFQRAACFSGFAHVAGFAAARRCLRFLVRFLISIFGRPFVKRFALCYRTVVCPVLSVCSICDVGVLWPNGLTDQDETWHGGRPRPGHIVLDGDPVTQRDTPQFSAHVHCGQTVAHLSDC